MRHHRKAHVSLSHTTSYSTNVPVSVPSPNLILMHTRQVLHHPVTSLAPMSLFQSVLSLCLTSNCSSSIFLIFQHLISLLPLNSFHTCSFTSRCPTIPPRLPLPKSWVRNDLSLVFWFSMISLPDSKVIPSQCM